MQTQAVEQLGFFGRQAEGQIGHGLRIGVIGVLRHAGHRLHDRHALQHGAHVFERGGCRNTVQTQSIHQLHNARAIAVGQGSQQAQHMAAVHTAQHLAHTRLQQLAAAKGNGLVGQAERIAHRAPRSAGQQAQSRGLGAQVFGLQDAGEVLKNRLRCHGAQVELQATREHRDRHFLRIGRGQHELQVLGRLFERLEHRVERGVGEHVDFVDHEDLEAPLDGLVNRLLQQALHFVHAPVGGGIQFGVVHKTAGIDVATSLAHAAGFGRDAALPVQALAVERLGQNARHRGLAHPSGSSEQVSVVQALLGQRIGQSLNHMLLPHHFGERTWAVLAGKDKVRHRVRFYRAKVQPESQGCPFS